MSITEGQIISALRNVNDPEIHRDLVSLNMVKDIRIDEGAGRVELTVVLTTPACPLKAKIEGDVKQALIVIPGVTSVHVNFTSNVAATVSPQAMARGIRNIIGVASGKGGVGKSTVSTNLALALGRQGARVGLLDADVYGPNIPLMMGLLNVQPELREVRDHQTGQFEKMLVPAERHGIKVMSMGFLTAEDEPVVWRGPMLNSVLRQFFAQVDWGELDYLIVDLPPGTGDIHISLTQLVPLAGLVYVTTPQAVALQDARKGIMMYRNQKIDALGLVENMSYFTPPGSSEKYYIFGQGGGERLAGDYAIPFLGEMPITMAVREGGDTGAPVVMADPDSEMAQRFMEIASQVAAQVSVTNFRKAEGQLEPAL